MDGGRFPRLEAVELGGAAAEPVGLAAIDLAAALSTLLDQDRPKSGGGQPLGGAGAEPVGRAAINLAAALSTLLDQDRPKSGGGQPLGGADPGRPGADDDYRKTGHTGP